MDFIMQEELIEKAKKGNKEAFTELVLYFEKDLYKIARTRLQSDDDISDVFQETVISAFKSIKKLKKNEYFKTWIIKILINNCNSLYTRRKNQKEYYLEELRGESGFLNENNVDIIIDELSFDALIKSLDYDERIILTLYYAEGYTSKEIGEILKLNENTIKSKISRAKIKLKKMLKED